MGRHYEEGRNVDAGPGKHHAVSRLSPYVRKRLVTEKELVTAAIEAHGANQAEKFIQEVIWRGYFKGWLERHPSVWADYRSRLARDLSQMQGDAGLRDAVAAAETGKSGLECFDFWARELVETGYLHNHARMWFASIWIFTLKLPWRVGADFFLRHLLDGDPASNTLGWRWVAGLHTRGRAYEANAWNIEKFSLGRFRPKPSELASDVQPLDGEEPHGPPPLSPLREINSPQTGAPTALLVTEDDCRVEEYDLSHLDIRCRATLAGSSLRSSRPVAQSVIAFERAALDDTAARLGHTATELHATPQTDLVDWVHRAGAVQIVTPYIVQGPLRDWLCPQLARLSANGIALCEIQRDWDRAIWPHATAGFFKVKKRIPEIFAAARVQ
ncbi:DNA photolyase-like FAD binding protein [Aliiruegeria haliotis]|uniref:DNA photolyase-like FAD binding protein n=1 Tax=Aliiruegeria haliotis TaxID=1280846 RepID=A0A2T0RM88_9RHOB|nr:FAD-binding domain-containing protein [Aliiruegeria haliotis]PRY22251.1 DNA photolyase-like FAD binding protein [Aliiruegeria haliotis]